MNKDTTMKGNNNLAYGKRDSLSDTLFTPPSAVKALLKVEEFKGIGWEPAAGCGNISRCFEPPLMSSDFSDQDWTYGEKGVDFLSSHRNVDFIITNPPYSLGEQFVSHALECATKVAFLMRLQFLESQRRAELFRRSPLKAVYVFSNRVKCYSPTYDGEGPGISSQSLAWFVWERGSVGEPVIRWLNSDVC